MLLFWFRLTQTSAVGPTPLARYPKLFVSPADQNSAPGHLRADFVIYDQYTGYPCAHPARRRSRTPPPRGANPPSGFQYESAGEPNTCRRCGSYNERVSDSREVCGPVSALFYPFCVLRMPGAF